MAIQVFIADEQDARPVEPHRLAALARAVLADREVGRCSEAELNVLLVDERTIASMNERFLGHRGPTDVLSFPIEDDLLRTSAGAPAPAGGEPPLLLGDVVICPEVAFRNAPGHAGAYEDELSLLLVHGILHLLGMDHERDDEAEEMEELERRLLARYHEERDCT